jgi:hypothetical protein
MRQRFLRTAWCLGVALALATTGYAQESKVKVESENYKMKLKTDGDEYKLEEKGSYQGRPEPASPDPVIRTSTNLREGQTVTTIKTGQIPEVKSEVKEEPKTVTVAKKKPVAKKAYASKKSCSCKNKVAARNTATKRAVAYKPKLKTTTSTSVAKTTSLIPPAAPVVVRDTVFVSRVDTVYSVMERDVFTGYSSQNTIPLSSDFTELKIEKEDEELKLKIEYEDGSETKKSFSTKEDLNLYLESDLERKETLKEID